MLQLGSTVPFTVGGQPQPDVPCTCNCSTHPCQQSWAGVRGAMQADQGPPQLAATSSSSRHHGVNTLYNPAVRRDWLALQHRHRMHHKQSTLGPPVPTSNSFRMKPVKEKVW